MKKLLVALAGLVVPGLGHIVMGRIAKGLVFLLVLTGMFVAGITFDTDYYHRFGISPMGETFEPIADQGDGPTGEGLIDVGWKYLFTYVFPFVTGIVVYVGGFFLRDVLRPLITSFSFIPDLATVPVTVKDIGYCFALLAGLLNVLVMMDAYDVAFNAELFREAAESRREKWVR